MSLSSPNPINSGRPEWDCILTAAQRNDTAEIKRLVSDGISVNHSNALGQSALHVAALWGNGKLITLQDCFIFLSSVLIANNLLGFNTFCIKMRKLY